MFSVSFQIDQMSEDTVIFPKRIHIVRSEQSRRRQDGYRQIGKFETCKCLERRFDGYPRRRKDEDMLIQVVVFKLIYSCINRAFISLILCTQVPKEGIRTLSTLRNEGDK